MKILLTQKHNSLNKRSNGHQLKNREGRKILKEEMKKQEELRWNNNISNNKNSYKNRIEIIIKMENNK